MILAGSSTLPSDPHRGAEQCIDVGPSAPCECAARADLHCTSGHLRGCPYCTGATVIAPASPVGGGLVQLGVSSKEQGTTVHRQWNISSDAGTTMPDLTNRDHVASTRCVDAPAFFVHVPWSPLIGGGVNYYQFHVDVLLPLVTVLSRRGLLPSTRADPRTGTGARAVLLPAVCRDFVAGDDLGLRIDWSPPAAAMDPASFWMTALQLVTDRPLVPFSHAHAPAATCFADASFGLPSNEHPSASTVVQGAGFLRGRLGLTEEPLPCDAPDTVSFVRRTNRRAILNEGELAAALERALDGVRVAWMNFGAGLREDVAALQATRVLVGGQGSGLTNGWYLPARSAVVCLYQLGAWDVFEEYLAPQRPYLRWVNSDPARSFCNRTVDPFCDSPDTLVDIPGVVAVIAEALARARDHCV